MNGLKVEIAWCLDCCVQYHIWQYFLLSCFRLFLAHDCVSHTIFFFLVFFILYKHTEAFRSIFSYLIPSLVMFYIITRSLLLSCPSRVKLKSIFYTLYFFFAIITHVFLCICDYYFSINAFKVVYIVERLFNHFLSVYLSVFFSPVWDPSKSL